jgi:hypothetical protein
MAQLKPRRCVQVAQDDLESYARQHPSLFHTLDFSRERVCSAHRIEYWKGEFEAQSALKYGLRKETCPRKRG